MESNREIAKSVGGNNREIAKFVVGDITKIESGVIVQQVNCRNAYGAGLSGQISRVYPEVLQDYRRSFTLHTPQSLFGTYRVVKTSNPAVTVINCYTQFEYRDSLKTCICYTSANDLVHCLENICREYRDVHIPYKIGCGFGGGNWDEIYDRIKGLPVTIHVPSGAAK